MEPDRRQFLRLAGASAIGTFAAGCLTDGGDGGDAGERPHLETEPNYRGWFDGVSNYDGTVDYRGETAVTVDVGVSGDVGYYKFGPPAVAVTPETDVRWEWTGRGGAHNVVAEHDRFDSGEPVDDETRSFSHTFDAPAVYRYACEPHRSQGMRGAVFVSLDPQE